MSRLTTYRENEEPISGYKLTEFLGRGKYGEVWKAIDSAGRRVAVKFVDLTENITAMRELRSFELLKNLDHPHLIPIFTARLKDSSRREIGFDRADEAKQKGTLKELVIAMGLGEKSLAGRLKELNPDGTPPRARKGLPVPELIQYMEGVAKGIDFLNAGPHKHGQIIHREIKPDNLFIVANEAKIADFGLALVVTPDATKTQVGGTGSYSPPELAKNQPTLGTDQYSLAVTYYELRTGRLPFPEGMSPYQLMFVHVEGRLDFSAPQVNDEERRALKKATAMNPKERYESCTRFVRALSRAVADQLDGSIILQEPKGGFALPPQKPPKPAAKPIAPAAGLDMTYIPTSEMSPRLQPQVPQSSPRNPVRPTPPPPPPPAEVVPLVEIDEERMDDVPPPPKRRAEPARPARRPDEGTVRPPTNSGAPGWRGGDPPVPAVPPWKGGVSNADIPPAGGVPDWRKSRQNPDTDAASSIAGLPRRANVRYYERMTPDRAFPFEVVLSAEELQEAARGAVRSASSAGFQLDPGAGVDIEPVLPGCDVSPPRETVQLGQEPVSCTFYVVPRVLGPLRGARVVVRQNGRAVAEVPLDIKVAKPTLAYVLGGLGFLASPLGAVPKEAGLPVGVAYGLIGLGVALLVAGLVAFLLLKPKQKDAYFDSGRSGGRPAWAK